MTISSETQIAVLQNQMNNVENKLDVLNKKFDDFLKDAPSMFAGKWVETLFKYVVVATLLAVLGGLYALVGLHIGNL